MPLKRMAPTQVLDLARKFCTFLWFRLKILPLCSWMIFDDVVGNLLALLLLLRVKERRSEHRS